MGSETITIERGECGLSGRRKELPRRFGDTGNLSIARQLPEADAADSEETHEAVTTMAEPATVVHARGELGLFASAHVPQVFCEPVFLAVDEGETGHKG